MTPQLQETIAQTTTYAGAVTAITFWGLSVSEWAVIASAAVALLGFVFTVVMRLRRERREIREHNAKMALLQGDTPPYRLVNTVED